MNPLLARYPVIVGVGESIDRPERLDESLDPVALMLRAVAAADQDAGGGFWHDADSVEIVRNFSTPYPDLPAAFAARAGLGRLTPQVGDGSGNGPIKQVHDAALRIQRGESEVAVICGAEAQASVERARKENHALAWMPEAAEGYLFKTRPFAHPEAIKYGLRLPLQIYPLYENAVAAALGQTPREAFAESARVWAGMSKVAASNPYAWRQHPVMAEEVETVSQSNRLLAWPYVKMMVAQPFVNQGSAIILTTYARARAAGIPQERLVFPLCGAAAREPDDYLDRDRYDRSIAQTVVLGTILDQMGWKGSRFDAVELYSCFPVVPKTARRLLGMPEKEPVTVAGGLTFFGGPVNNYMSHGAVAMVRRLRRQPSATGLLYSQGGYMTKHHAMVIVSASRPDAPLAGDYDVQAEADRRRETPPPVVSVWNGPAAIESFTVLYGRDGTPEAGIVLALTPASERVLARVPATDRHGIALLTALDRTPIGRHGHIAQDPDGMNIWSH